MWKIESESCGRMMVISTELQRRKSSTKVGENQFYGICKKAAPMDL